jgi:hypothetical protein
VMNRIRATYFGRIFTPQPTVMTIATMRYGREQNAVRGRAMSSLSALK